MFRYRRAKFCKACVKNDTNSCATNITIAQPRNAPPRPNREKAINTIENGNEVPTFVPNQNTVQDKHFYSGGFGNPTGSNRKLNTLMSKIPNSISVNSFDPNKAIRTAYAEHVGSMGRIERIKARNIAGDKLRCQPLNIGDSFVINVQKFGTAAGYLNIPEFNFRRGKINGDNKDCMQSINGFSIRQLNSYINNLGNKALYFQLRQKFGIFAGTTPNVQAISFKGTPTGNVIDTETVILLLTETNTFGGGFTVTVSGGIPVINAVWDQNTPNNKAEKVYDILENTENVTVRIF